VHLDLDGALEFPQRHTFPFKAGVEIQIALPCRLVEHRCDVHMVDVHLRSVAQRHGQQVGLSSECNRPHVACS
jgi:hypothetical protein